MKVVLERESETLWLCVRACGHALMCEFIIYASVLWGQAKRFGTTQFNFEENHLGQMAILINTVYHALGF